MFVYMVQQPTEPIQPKHKRIWASILPAKVGAAVIVVHCTTHGHVCSLSPQSPPWAVASANEPALLPLHSSDVVRRDCLAHPPPSMQCATSASHSSFYDLQPSFPPSFQALSFRAPYLLVLSTVAERPTLPAIDPHRNIVRMRFVIDSVLIYINTTPMRKYSRLTVTAL